MARRHRGGIAAAAECPNVVIKLGGIGMPRTGFDWHERDVPASSEELANPEILLQMIAKSEQARRRFWYDLAAENRVRIARRIWKISYMEVIDLWTPAFSLFASDGLRWQQ